MSTLAARKRRERTNTNKKRASQTFSAPGVYYPIAGKTSIYISGHGQAGNTPSNASVSYYNPATPGNVSGANPVVPGNFVNTNPSTPGNYAGTNQPSGGNVAYYNPDTPGNISGYNNSSPGNQSYNPPVPGQIVYQVTNGPGGYHTESEYVSGSFAIGPYTNYSSYNQYYSVTNVARPSGFYVPGNSFYNPSMGGSANYNDDTPGNAVYNSYNPGSAYYNPTVPGNANYNPSTGGTSNYNPGTPGNAVFNNSTVGVPGVPFTVLNVNFPGGNVSSAAPVIGRTLTYAPYLAGGAGYPVDVQPGGVVIIEET